VTRRETAAQAARRRERDRAGKARARLRAKGLDPDQVPGPSPARRRVVLPVSRASGSGWQDRAACRTSPPEWFDAETDQDAARALAVCAGCPVRRECLAAAAADRAAWGVWGGVDLSAPGRAAVAS
jgi:Transcription factor WhiB